MVYRLLENGMRSEWTALRERKRTRTANGKRMKNSLRASSQPIWVFSVVSLVWIYQRIRLYTHENQPYVRVIQSVLWNSVRPQIKHKKSKYFFIPCFFCCCCFEILCVEKLCTCQFRDHFIQSNNFKIWYDLFLSEFFVVKWSAVLSICWLNGYYIMALWDCL